MCVRIELKTSSRALAPKSCKNGKNVYVNIPHTRFPLKTICDFNRFVIRAAGIPELGIEEVEPIVIDEINLALGSGPDGYRATFKDIQAYGVSNLTVNQVR